MTSLFFCQNDSPVSKSFWQKNRLVTHILFDLCVFEHFSPDANFEQQSIAVSVYPSLINSCRQGDSRWKNEKKSDLKINELYFITEWYLGYLGLPQDSPLGDNLGSKSYMLIQLN